MRVRLGWAFYVAINFHDYSVTGQAISQPSKTPPSPPPPPTSLPFLAVYGELSKVCFILNHQHSHHDPYGAEVRMGAGEGVREDLVTCLRPGAHTEALPV